MGQDGEQKPGGKGQKKGERDRRRGRWSGNAEVKDHWGLGSGFTSGVKAKRWSLKRPERVPGSRTPSAALAAPPVLAFWSVLLNSPGPEAVPFQSPVTQSLWVWELNLSLSECPRNSIAPPHLGPPLPPPAPALFAPCSPLISESWTPVTPASFPDPPPPLTLYETELLSPSCRAVFPGLCQTTQPPQSQSSSIPDAISSPITMGTTLWEPAGPARLTKIDSKEKTWEKTVRKKTRNTSHGEGLNRRMQTGTKPDQSGTCRGR